MARTRGRPAGPLLTRQGIVDEAIRLLERDGVAAFSVNTLAASLGVTPRAVRYRMGSRDGVLLAVADCVAGEVTLPGQDLDWEDWLRLTATAVRSVLLAKPAVIHVVLEAWSSTTRGAELAATSLDVLLDAADGDLAAAVSAHNAFWAFVAGVVYSHAPSSLRGAVRSTVDAVTAVEDHEAVGAALDRLASAYRSAYPSASPLDVAFTSALDVALSGIRLSLTADARAGQS